jgi:hypothetical protein
LYLGDPNFRGCSLGKELPMRRELMVPCAYAKDRKRGLLYEIVEKKDNKVTLLDVSHRTNPDQETLTLLIGTAESRLTYVEPEPDWSGIASVQEWGPGYG